MALIKNAVGVPEMTGLIRTKIGKVDLHLLLENRSGLSRWRRKEMTSKSSEVKARK